MIKKTFYCALVGSLTPTISLASSVAYDFESESVDDIFADGEVAGWTQDISNPPGFFGEEFPIAYIDTDEVRTGSGTTSGFFFGTSASNAAYLGNLRGNQIGLDSTSVSTTIDTSGLTPTVPRVQIDLGIVNFANNFFGDNPVFDFRLTGGSGGELARIQLDRTGTAPGDWNIAVSSNGSTPTVSSSLLTPQVGYTFTIDFESSGTVFSYGETVGGGSSLIGTESAVANYAGRVGGVTLTHNPGANNDEDSRALIFDNLSVSVPEVSTSVFAALGMLFLGYRRRS